jgi:hypothetical protein
MPLSGRPYLCHNVEPSIAPVDARHVVDEVADEVGVVPEGMYELVVATGRDADDRLVQDVGSLQQVLPELVLEAPGYLSR